MHAMKAYVGTGGIAGCIPNCETRWSLVVSLTRYMFDNCEIVPDAH